MIYYERHNKDGNTIYIWKAEEDVEQIAKALQLAKDSLYLSLGPKRKKEWAFTRLLLRYIDNTQNIAYRDSGKPDLNNNKKKISISHTGDYVAILVNEYGKEIGIDIEKRHKTKILNLLTKFLTEQEQRLKITEDKEVNGLLTWTSKEALFKIIDPTVVDYTRDMEIQSITIHKEVEGDGCIKFVPTQTSYQLKYKIFEDFVMSWGNE